MLRRHSYFDWRWIEDGAGRHTTDVMEGMPADVVETALARGVELDLGETAAELLEELRALSWDKGVVGV